MGRYLKTSLEIPTPHLSPALTRALLDGEFFRTTGVGAMTGHPGGGLDWFLGGYTLETFVDHYLRRGMEGPKSIETCPAAPGAAYRARIAAALRARFFRDALADCERADPSAETTFVDAAATLNEDDLAPLGPWLGQHADAAVSIHGTVSLAVDPVGGEPWSRAFRELVPKADADLLKLVGIPFLKVGVSPNPFSPGHCTLTLFTESRVWLRAGGALAGRVGPAQADENLRLLATFTRMLREVSGARSAELSIEGSAFRDEADRLRAAFAGIADEGGPSG